jgi:hypothetical protein
MDYRPVWWMGPLVVNLGPDDLFATRNPSRGAPHNRYNPAP